MYKFYRLIPYASCFPPMLTSGKQNASLGFNSSEQSVKRALERLCNFTL